MALPKDMLATATPVATTYEQKRAAALAVCTMVPRYEVRSMLIDLGLYAPLKEHYDRGIQQAVEGEEAAEIVRSARATSTARAYPARATRIY